MAGNTSSSPSSRSVGYVSTSSADNTTVNIYVDSAADIYSQTAAQQPNQINYEFAPGITTSNKKSYSYVSTVPTVNGKYGFDSLTPTASATTSVQKIGSSVKLSQSNNSKKSSTTAVAAAATTPKFNQKPSVTSDNKFSASVPVAPQNPGDYEWNLPPHMWSMPRLPNSDPNNMPPKSNKVAADDRYRRGRIWWKASDTSLSTVDSSGKVTKIDNSSRQYGFQFLWNPTNFGTNVAVQMDATPNVNDRFLSTVGAFPATESISFTLRIDRINDFACANAIFKRPNNIGSALGNPGSNNFITPAEVARFIPYYQNNGSFTASLIRNGRRSSVESKLIDLFQRGTLADIEYIYKAINGAGPGSTASGGDYWKNGRGIITADIGFLMPTLLNIDVGPLSYIGYVNSMSVVHNMFTADMTPIQSDISLSFQLLATAGIGNG
jgi:hypothetical protein